MSDEQFKMNVCNDLGYIKAKLENFDNIIVPCEKESVKASVKLNRVMIFAIYGLLSAMFLGLMSKTYTVDANNKMENSLDLVQTIDEEPQIPKNPK